MTSTPKGFPFDPLTLGMYVLSWAIGLGPKVQTAASTTTPMLAPAKVYSTVVDALFGGVDGQESALWLYLMGEKPAGISQEMHEACADLTECGARVSADLVDYISARVYDAQQHGENATDVVRDIRNEIDSILDEHDIESDVQAVLDAK